MGLPEGETDESLLGQIVDEFTDRCHRGESVETEEFAQRYPSLGTVLRQVLPAIQALAQQTMDIGVPAQSLKSPLLSELQQYFPQYDLIAELGSGGMGTIYRARHKQLHRDVAIKIVRPELQLSASVIERFRAESRAIAKLQHPHIVQIHEVGESSGMPYLVLEYCGGGSLAQQHSPLLRAPAEAARLTLTVAQAIHAAHQAGLIHRDLKPANILLTSTGVVKVTDFGLVKSLDQDTGHTQTGAIVGTPSYMSPEQTLGDSRLITAATDVYAIGAILYDLLTGRPPFKAASMIQTMDLVRQQEPVRPTQLNAAIPRDLETICLKCLRKEIPERYHSAAELSDDLEAFLQHRPIRARRVTTLERALKFARRSPLLATVLILLPLTILLGGIGMVVIAERTRQQGEQERLLAEADGTATALLNADIQQLPALLPEIQKNSIRIEPALRRLLSDGDFTTDSRERLNAALALLTLDPTQQEVIRQQLPQTSAQQLSVIAAVVARYPGQLPEHCEHVLSDTTNAAGHRFRAACLLAGLNSASSLWNNSQHGQFVARQLVQVTPSELGSWHDLLKPILSHLEPALEQIRNEPQSSEQSQLFAFDLLADYHAQNVDALLNLLIDAQPAQFAIVLSKLRTIRPAAILRAKRFMQHNEPLNQTTQEETFEQRSRIVALLAHLNGDDNIWSLFRRQPDPRLTSFLIHNFPRLAVPEQLIWQQVQSSANTDIRFGLLLCLGGYSSLQFSDNDRQLIIQQLLQWYSTEPDSGVHSAIAFLLHRWGYAQQEQQTRQQLTAKSGNLSQSADHRRWYVNSQHQTFVILDAGSFVMGSAETLPWRDADEQLHQRRINRRFAIAAREVTRADLLRFQPDFSIVQRGELPEPDCPVGMVNWYTAAAYCNWLSQQDGIPVEQWCYQPNDAGEYAEGMRAADGFLRRSGYRLPTEAEWEFASRAMTTTSRYYGDSEALLSEYAWYSPLAGDRCHPVGQLLPNAFGLFDTLGNQYEWCHDVYQPYASIGDDSQPLTADDHTDDSTPARDTDRRVLRGGSFDHSARHSRSAYRTNDLAPDQISNNGIRPARTLHP